ncbi:MAG: hypothetical protein JXQ75_01805 [Phycisphaerae bacterium]|nr:hypothetical protein [Phycisphaerae bacterium]
MDFQNTTHLDSLVLNEMVLRAVASWPHDGLDVFVRYSRGAEFSGTCYYAQGRIYVNLGRRNRYPYLIRTNIARAQSNRRYWWREVYSVESLDAYQLVLFVFMHEFYHWLVKKARRNVRQKEARCDRFATRALVDGYGAAVLDSDGRRVARESWDFQDLDGFVAAAVRSARGGRKGVVVPSSAVKRGPPPVREPGGQLRLFGPEAFG